jgi:hypothetical protein
VYVSLKNLIEYSYSTPFYLSLYFFTRKLFCQYPDTIPGNRKNAPEQKPAIGAARPGFYEGKARYGRSAYSPVMCTIF